MWSSCQSLPRTSSEGQSAELKYMLTLLSALSHLNRLLKENGKRYVCSMTTITSYALPHCMQLFRINTTSVIMLIKETKPHMTKIVRETMKQSNKHCFIFH